MDPIEGLWYGLSLAFTYQNLLAAFAGAFAGTAIGVLPGFGPTAGLALLLPFTYAMGPSTGLIMMASMLYGAMYGGSTTAILMNMPGEAASVMTCIDGYKLTKKGRAGAVLFIVAAGSFVGGTISIVGVMLFVPTLAELAIIFGPGEFFALTAGGLLLLSRISAGTMAAGLLPMAIGLLLSTVGQEAVSGQYRFTFGINDLAQGLELAVLAVGVYGIAEVMVVVESLADQAKPMRVRVREMLPTRAEIRRSWAPMGRGTIVGFLFGLLPGPATTLSTFTAYRLEKAVSKYKHEIGEGAIEGVAAPETANNAAATSLMVPLLGLGIPFSSATALMLGAMMVHNVQPGPLLMTIHPEIFWAVIASMFVGNIMLVVINVPMIGLWVNMLRIPAYILLPTILMMAVIGSYSLRNSMFDVSLLLGLGILGYVLRKLEFQLAPLVVGVVLGPMIEKHFREGLYMSQGDLSVFWSSPITIGIWSVVFIVVALGGMSRLWKRIFPPGEGEG
ncbi:MAG: tripartite tricarboxylate transporter permease [Rhodospirillales bacterium]|jgi:putative tricarboxylic transport membrane protein|nr:tripartite tricarboxylate transporter permease [Magnetospirillum sp.]